MPKVGKTYTSLYKQAVAFNQMGWSCIPLRGEADLSHAKAPALASWKAYQTRLPNQNELQNWFVSSQCSAIGVVLGNISGIVVIDIDSPQMAEAFAQCFPKLTDTFTVRSGYRCLPHYYFAIDSDRAVYPIYGEGIELKADGQYIVAPHSWIGGKHWQIVNQEPPLKLSEADLSDLTAFIGSSSQKTQESPDKVDFTNLGHSDVSGAYLVHLYHKLAASIGRNNALFRVGCFARDRGWTQDTIKSVLVEIHAKFQSKDGSSRESVTNRRREALRTLASVFSRPGRKVSTSPKLARIVPNVLREYLLQSELDHVARVLDGLMLAAITPCTILTAASIYENVRHYGIGRNTVYAALRDGKMVFKSPHTPQLQTANAVKPSHKITNQCLIGRDSNPVKMAGRKCNVFVMPDLNDLCHQLDLENRGGDLLNPDDLKSPRAYRAAMHKALIKRSPGNYPRRWLAQRLGVSETTCRRYERQFNIHVVPTFHSQNLHWLNLEKVLPDDPEPGQFIQDDQGRRFPALASIARRLLAQKRSVFFRRQDANYYCVVEDENLPARSSSNQAPKPTSELKLWPRIIVKSNTQNQNAPIRNSQIAQSAACTPQTIGETAHNTQVDDTLLDRIYRTLRQRNPQRAMSRKRINQLIEHYGGALLERALVVLRSKSDIRNPSGFLIGWLRYQTGEAAEKVADKSASEDWLTRFKKSPYAQYCVF